MSWNIVIVFAHLLYCCHSHQAPFHDNNINLAVGDERNLVNWKKISLPEVVANEKASLTATFKAFGGNIVPELNHPFPVNVESFQEQGSGELTPETGVIDWENFENCSKQLQIWLDDISQGKLYALKMIDSWGKQEGGILEGNVRWLGHYSECLTAKGEDVSGRWCQAYFGFLYYPRPFGIPIDISKGLCFPSVCSEQSVEMLYRDLFLDNNTIPLLSVNCPEDPQWSTMDTICSCIVGVLLLLAVAGFVADINFRMQQKSEKNSERSTESAGPTAHSIPVQMLLSFSPLTNAEKVLDSSRRPGTLPVLDGIRFLSTTWVVLGHTLQMMLFGLSNPIQAKRRIVSDPSVLAITNGTYSVDTFFLLSGLLVAYIGMKQLRKSKGSLNIPLMYLQRYLRLTPLYAFMILFSMSLHKYLGSGPAWEEYSDGLAAKCTDNWWTNLVYINNVYPLFNYCYPVSWYLANDMQFYILAPIFLLLLYRWRVVGILSICFVIVGGIVTNGVLASLNDIQPSLVGLYLQLNLWYRLVYYLSFEDYDYNDKFSGDLYFLPWARIHVYMIGMLTGYILFVTKGKIKMHKVVVAVGWIVAAGCSLGIVYGLYEYAETLSTMETDLSAFYNAMSRPVWGACVAWVIIACTAGYGGPITKFLNWNVFIPLSRLTYSAYLVHWLVLYWYGANQEQPFHFLMINYTYTFLGNLVITFLCAFIVCVLIEWPFLGLFKAIFSPLINAKSKEENRDSISKWMEMNKEDFQVEENTDKVDSTEDNAENVYDNESYVNEKSGNTVL